MLILGIDPGLKGGLVALQGTEVVLKAVMPVAKLTKTKKIIDRNKLARLIEDLNPDHTCVEQIIAMPRQSAQSGTTTGIGWGVIVGILAALKLRNSDVSSKTWQTAMFRDRPKDDTKALAALVCSNLWPRENWIVSLKTGKPDEGLCDAELIAEYTRRTNGAA